MKKYEKGDLTVVWQPSKCIHSGVCVANLGSVFRPTEKPWIQVVHASQEDIRKTIDKCPSGALSYVLASDTEGEPEEKDATNVKVNSGASIRVQGPLEVTLPDGTVEVKENGASFCRCGASQRKPYCDGSHREVEFQD